MCKQYLRSAHPRIYSQDLLNNLFRHPYTMIEFVMQDLQVNRATASKYLRLLVADERLSLHKIGRTNYYMNDRLTQLFAQATND